MDKKEEHHANRFNELPEAVQQWLSNLREDDINEMKEAIKLVRNAHVVGKFTRWAIVTIVATFITMVALGETIMKVIKWVFPSGKH